MPGSRQHHTQPRQAGQSPSQGRGQRQQKEAMALVGAIYTHLAAALTPPPPNAFEIAALVAGVMDETSGGPPTSGELLELVQARTALLNGPGVATTGRSPIGPKTQLKRQKRSSTCSLPWRGMQEKGGSLANLRNLLDEAAQGVTVLVGEYPHKGVAEALAPKTHPADTLGLARLGTPRPDRAPPNPRHVCAAKARLRRLIPFLVGNVLEEVKRALKALGRR